MKRVFQHPPEPLTGKKYWRSLGELSDTPEFRQWLEREFPAGASELNDDEWSRRGFLKLMGASMALAGIGLNGCRRPEAHLVPFTKSAEWTIPGKPLFYATAMPRRNGAIPLVVTTHDGRPTKIDGNPLHAASGGATDTHAQASVLDLYDPARSKYFREKGKISDRAAFEKYLEQSRSHWMANQGGTLAFLAEPNFSPTRDRLRNELQKVFPKMSWCEYDPLLSSAQAFATEIGFGERSRLVPRLDRADVILALDSDFLDCGQGDLELVRGFSARRRMSAAKDAMNRLYVVENRYTLTGAMADHRLRVAASQIPAFTRALAEKMIAVTKDSSLGNVVGTLPAQPDPAKFDDQWLTEVVNDLVSKTGASLVLAGPDQPVVVQLLAYAMNIALKNLGRTFIVREFPTDRRIKSILQLASDIGTGRIEHLFILGGDPVYNAPRTLFQDRASTQLFDWADLQKKVPDVVRVGYHEDATSALSKWHVPAAHFLESWGDALTSRGAYLSIQPMILPLFGGMSDIEIMNSALGRPKPEGPELVQETFRSTNPPGDFETAWSRFLRDGFAVHVAPKDKPSSFNANASAGVARNLWSSASAPSLHSPEIVFVPSYAMDNGSYINNGWLQELPDPITKLTWDNAAQMSPTMAAHLGVETGDLVRIVVTDTRKVPKEKNNPAEKNMPGERGSPIERELVIAALVQPGHADNSITIPLGYGRKTTGGRGALPYAGRQDDASPAGEGAGFNAYLLRTPSNPHYVVADGQAVASVKVSKVGQKYPLSITQDHWSIEGRGVVREATLDRYRDDNEFVKKLEESLPPQPPSLYSHPPLDAEQQWGMTVDLNVCTGCSACVIACQSENNVPIVGKLQVSHGRAMHWIRIDRYYASHKEFNQDAGDWPQDPEVVHQPMMCQHCENAPCETVCPVNATVHSEDGLNVMAYNRCVGTRYCANNCPFKVRRFNYFDYNQRPVGKKKIKGQFGIYKEYFAPFTGKGAPDTMKMQKNPNVTVRMRGVMEKCTFCVQRIEEAKIAAKVRAGASNNVRIPRDSFTSACAQACPSDAIVFGDIKDPESRVSKLKQQDRNYRLLNYLNVNTRTSYLARIRNPNPKMPDAAKIGVASMEEKA